MRSVRYWLFMMAVLLIVPVMLCACDDRPAYYTPYGEGVDPSTVTTGSYIRPSAPSTTGLVIVPTTTSPPTTVPTRLAAPLKGHVVCPTCNGIMQPCEYCQGTLYRRGEMFDPDSGIVRRYKIKCNMCAEDPGYTICKTCQNKLVVPNEE